MKNNHHVSSIMKHRRLWHRSRVISRIKHLVERFLQHFALTKDNELKAGQQEAMCVEEASDSVLLVSCNDESKQWKISQVKPI